MTDIDPVKFGEMLESVRTLKETIGALDKSLVTLNSRLETVELRFRLGKTGLIGLVVGLGFAIFGFKETLLVLWSKLT